MRRVVLFLSAWSLGCLSQDWCTDAPCPPPATDACEGACAPFVGGVWSPVLVKTARTTNEQCPNVAPLTTTATATVIACGVQEAGGECSSDELVCLRSAPGWTACVVRVGAAGCPTFYETEVEAEDGVTLCCPREEPVP